MQRSMYYEKTSTCYDCPHSHNTPTLAFVIFFTFAADSVGLASPVQTCSAGDPGKLHLLVCHCLSSLCIMPLPLLSSLCVGISQKRLRWPGLCRGKENLPIQRSSLTLLCSPGGSAGWSSSSHDETSSSSPPPLLTASSASDQAPPHHHRHHPGFFALSLRQLCRRGWTWSHCCAPWNIQTLIFSPFAKYKCKHNLCQVSQSLSATRRTQASPLARILLTTFREESFRRSTDGHSN